MGGVPEWPKGSDCKSDAQASVVRIHPPPPLYLCAIKAQFERRKRSGGYSSAVEPQPSKLDTRVRFPLPAPFGSHSSGGRALPW